MGYHDINLTQVCCSQEYRDRKESRDARIINKKAMIDLKYFPHFLRL